MASNRKWQKNEPLKPLQRLEYISGSRESALCGD